MATTMARRRGVPTPFDWTLLSWLPAFGPSIRIEEYLEKDRYVVRAEVPGIDAAKDVEITTADGNLRVHVQRTEERKAEPEEGAGPEKVRSEFQYGSLHRTVPLPAGAREEEITATYADGILEIIVPIGERPAVGRTIPVEVGKARKH